MFASSGDNLKYCVRSVAQRLRGVEIETLNGCGVSVEKIEDVLLYGMDEKWRELAPPELSLGEWCQLALAAGVGLSLAVAEGEELDRWVQEVEAGWSPGESQALVPVARRCAVCRHPKRIEIDVCLAKGISLTQLRKLFNVSLDTLSRHRNLCLAGRLERLAQGLGNAADLSSLVGTVTVMDKVMDFANRAGEGALANQEHAAVEAILGRMLQGVEIRAKLTGEMSERETEPGGPAGQGGFNPQVSVMVVPSREQLEAQMVRPIGPMVVDVKGDRA